MRRNELVERLAASVYKQGELSRAAGDNKAAIGHFNRVATVAPTSTVRANAQYDAAAAMIALKDWEGASRSLEDFRSRFPITRCRPRWEPNSRWPTWSASSGAGRLASSSAWRPRPKTPTSRAKRWAIGRAAREGRRCQSGPRSTAADLP